MKINSLINASLLVVFFLGHLPIPAAHAREASAPAVAQAIPAAPTATATPASKPTPQPTNTAEQTLSKPGYQITLTSASEFIDPVTNTCTINWSVTAPAGYDLFFAIPQNVTLKPGPTSEYDTAARIYRTGAAETGSLLLTVLPGTEMPVTINAWLASSATSLETLQSGKAAPNAQASISLYEKASMDARGGQVGGLNGKVNVFFPANAVLDGTDVFIHRPLPASEPARSLSGHPFEITARQSLTKRAISHFDKNLEIEVSYAEDDIPAALESDLKLSWYNPQSGGWVSLPTSVDTTTKTLTAVSDHFTVFDYSVDNWQASKLPTLDASQVSAYTGAASYTLPLEVPSGPGGLKPDLSLSYNSQVVDSATTLAQASWVGMGWSLDIGGIERNSNGTSSYEGDDTFMLTINGVGSNIIHDANGYHLSNENFWKVEKFSNPLTWKVTDKSGNQYFFDKTTTLNYYHESDHCNKSTLDIRWSLTKMVNIFGQEIKYNYTDENKDLTVPQWRQNLQGNWVCGSTATKQPANTATYLASIEYANAHYRVRFEKENRIDYNSDWENDASNHAFERQRLKEIIVEYDGAVVPGANYQIIRKYALEYFADSDTANLVFPGVVWAKGGRTTTLKKITQYGGGEDPVALPATEFSYVDDNLQVVAADDNLHLKKVSNGYGGETEFVYERWGVPSASYPGYASSYHIIAYSFGKAGNPCSHGDPTFGPRNVGDSVSCASSNPPSIPMIVNGGAIKRSLPENLVIPGGLYRLETTATANGVSAIDLGLYNGVTDQLIGGSSGLIELAPTASRADPVIKEAGSGKMNVKKYKFELLSSGWRVVTRTFSAGGQDNTYSYAYSGEAINTDANTSAGLLCADFDPYSPPIPQTCFESIPRNSEFRGHQQVTETAPNGQQTVQEFFQDEIQKGKPWKVTIQTTAGRKLSEMTYGYGADVHMVFETPIVKDCHVGDCHYHGLTWNWSYSSWVEQRTFASDGAALAVATRQEFGYDHAYGNLTTVISQIGNGTTWTNYKKSETSYVPNNGSGIYLAGYPSRQLVYAWQNSAWVLAAETLNIYDANSLSSQAPTTGILAATLTLVNDEQYAQTGFEYDPYGNRISVTSYSSYGTTGALENLSGARKNSMVYDGTVHAYPITITENVGGTPELVTNITYEDFKFGLPETEISPNGAETKASYDSFGRIIKLIRPGDSDHATMEFGYETPLEGGFRTSVIQRIDGNRFISIKREYDGMGRQTLLTRGSLLHYKPEENLPDVYIPFSDQKTLYVSAFITKQSMPFGLGETPAYTTTETDFSSQTTTVTAPDNTTTITSQNGLVTSVQDAKGSLTSSTQDAWGHTILVSPPTGPDVSYQYDALDRLMQTTRGGVSTMLTYDDAGRKTSMTDADMGIWSYGYDALGSLVTQKDARGCILSLNYDKLNRLTSKTSSETDCGTQTSTSFTYDVGTGNKGQRTGMTDGSGSTAWNYDLGGRMTQEVKTITGAPAPFTTAWTYNSADMPVMISYPDGEQVTNGYNDNGQLKMVTSSLNTSYLNDMQYDPAGRVKLMDLGAGVIRKTYNYTAWNDLNHGGVLQSMQTTRLSDAFPLQNLAYTYDKNRNILSITDGLAGPQVQSFSYDTLNRLTNAKAEGGTDGLYSETYSYDSASGNLSSKGGLTYTYADPAHAHAVTGLSNGNTYTYDSNGSQITRTIAGVGVYSQAYDAENQMTGVSGPNGMSASFAFDGDGKRVTSTIGTSTTYFVGNIYEVANGVVSKYYYAGGQRIALRSAGVVSYLLGDHLGSTSLTTDAAGLVSSEQRYTAWGEVRYSSGIAGTKYTYTGQYSNVPDFGLMFYNARWFDPGLGRFAQADSVVPGGVQGLDRYAGLGNSPVRYVDPSGHSPVCVMGGSSGCLWWAGLTGVNAAAGFEKSKGFNNDIDANLNTYGITVSGSLEEKKNAGQAAIFSGNKFSTYLKTNPQAAFRQAHGDIKIVSDQTRSNCETDSVTSTITCGASSFYITALLHEFGHIFDNRYNSLTNDKNAAGEDIGASGYVPSAWEGNSDGYKCVYSPCMEHSLQGWPNLPHNLSEEFGDMYLNWVVDNLNIDPAHMGFSNVGLGPDRRTWMNSTMPWFLEKMGVLK